MVVMSMAYVWTKRWIQQITVEKIQESVMSLWEGLARAVSFVSPDS